MERYFTLDKFNTWFDWHLILTGKDITPPEPKTNYIELDGMNGSMDLSETLTGEITYKDRTVTATFWTDYGNVNDRYNLFREITTALHGKKIKIVEPDDPTHYFYGRAKIKSFTNILPYAEFTIEFTCEPWRYAINETNRKIDVNNETINTVIFNNGVKTLIPIIEITGTIDITFNNATTTLHDGTFKISSVKLKRGSNVVGVSGTGSVNFRYTECDV